LDAAKELEIDSTDQGKFLFETLETKDPGRTHGLRPKTDPAAVLGFGSKTC